MTPKESKEKKLKINDKNQDQIGIIHNFNNTQETPAYQDAMKGY